MCTATSYETRKKCKQSNSKLKKSTKKMPQSTFNWFMVIHANILQTISLTITTEVTVFAMSIFVLPKIALLICYRRFASAWLAFVILLCFCVFSWSILFPLVQSVIQPYLYMGFGCCFSHAPFSFYIPSNSNIYVCVKRLAWILVYGFIRCAFTCFTMHSLCLYVALWSIQLDCSGMQCATSKKNRLIWFASEIDRILVYLWRFFWPRWLFKSFFLFIFPIHTGTWYGCNSIRGNLPWKFWICSNFTRYTP